MSFLFVIWLAAQAVQEIGPAAHPPEAVIARRKRTQVFVCKGDCLYKMGA